MNHTKEPFEDELCIKRFWSKVAVSGDNDCWLWTRGTSGFGYGNFHYGKMSIRAHRFSYQLKHGKITPHECVCHSCDNPLCVNPAHLWIGTRAENNADAIAKNRNVPPSQKSGEGNSNSSLTAAEVVAIRVMARCGMPQARIASYIGISAASVCMIVNDTRRTEETERRVSACVNACAGLSTDDLEKTGLISAVGYQLLNADKERDTYRDLCDELKNKLIASRFMFEAYGINLQKLGDEINESITNAETILGEKNGNAN